MAELVDALVLGTSVERRVGSSPTLGTKASVAKLVARDRLKICWTERSVSVRVRPEAQKESDPRRRVGPPAKRDVR